MLHTPDQYQPAYDNDGFDENAAIEFIERFMDEELELLTEPAFF